MNDLRTEIPRRAFINAQIMQLVVNTSEFRNCVLQVFTNYDLPEMALDYEFKGPSYVASLLYCLIVVPKEIWSLHENDEVYKLLKRERPLELFQVSLKDQAFDKNPTYQLIRRLRNSVAHADYEVTSNMGFVFYDRRNKMQQPNFIATASIEALSTFLSRIGAILANLSRHM
jgi:hypothetical protein